MTIDKIELITSRVSIAKLGDPAPDATALASAFAAAGRAPDHGGLRPWRFLTIAGEGRIGFRKLLGDSLLSRNPEATREDIARTIDKSTESPLIIVSIARLREHPKIPAIEQKFAVAAATQNLLLAFHAQGYGAIWRTGSAAYNPMVHKTLGLTANEAIVAFVHVGTPVKLPKLPNSTPIEEFVSSWPSDADP